MLLNQLTESGSWLAGADESSGVLNAGQAQLAADLTQRSFRRIVGSGKGTLAGVSGAREVGVGQVQDVDSAQGRRAAARDQPGERQGAAGRLAEVRSQHDFLQCNGNRRHFSCRRYWP